MSAAEDVKWLQVELRAIQLYQGKIDGILGVMTLASLIRYVRFSTYAPDVAHKLDLVLDRLNTVLDVELAEAINEEETSMATQATLDKLTAQVSANTSATAAAAAALAGFIATVADLTQKLQDAIASGDETAVKAAADAIEANNATLTAATPAVAAAVEANT